MKCYMSDRKLLSTNSLTLFVIRSGEPTIEQRIYQSDER